MCLEEGGGGGGTDRLSAPLVHSLITATNTKD